MTKSLLKVPGVTHPMDHDMVIREEHRRDAALAWYFTFHVREAMIGMRTFFDRDLMNIIVREAE